MQHDTLSHPIPLQAPSPSSQDITPIPTLPLFTDLTPPTTDLDTNSCTNRPLTPPEDHPSIYVTPRSRHQRSKSGQHHHYHHRQHPQRPESEILGGYHPRPNSFTSVYQDQLSRKSSFRRSKNGQKGDGEFNDSFERVRSLLTTLISDASTAVGGSSAALNTISVGTEFESFESGESGLEENDDQDVIEHGVNNYYNSNNNSNSNFNNNNNNEQSLFKDEDEDEDSLLDATVYGNEDERGYGTRRSRRHWTRKRAFMDEPSKRTSLFLELQNFQLKQELTDPAASADDRSFVTGAGAEADTEAEADVDVDADAALADDTLCEDCESSILSDGEVGDELLGHIVGCAEDQTWPSDSWDDSDMESSPMLSPRRCTSFPSWRSDHAELQLHTEELQQVIQRVDTELDRTAETIDGLTRDLMTVATHQSWLQMTLERTLQFHPMVEDAALAYFEDDFEAMNIDSSCDSPPSPSSKQQHQFPAPKDLSEYIQALKGVVAMGQGLGLGSFHLEGTFLPLSDGCMDRHEDLTDESNMQDMQRFSGSSYTLTNGSYRNSAASTFSLETRFDDTPELTQKAIENDNATVLPCSQDTPLPTGNNNCFDSSSTDYEPQDALSQDARPAELTIVNTPATTAVNTHSLSTDRKLQETLVLLDWLSPQSSLSRDQDLDTVMKQHHALLLKTMIVITRWITTNTHLILLIVSSVVFIVGTLFMDPLATREAGQRLVQRIETIGRLLEHVDGHDDIKVTEEVVDDGKLETVSTPVLEVFDKDL
ncbi:hypothetical protein BGZ50_003875 [Haplosporangium sp. Z 11]|nr:hypothetical protein BGZ50_003875 [Haplosporangium sp. Z 11]